MDKIEKEKWLIKLTLTLRSFSTKIELHIPQSVMKKPSTIIFLHHHFLSDKEKKKFFLSLKYATSSSLLSGLVNFVVIDPNPGIYFTNTK